jgi:hypothetical protein
MRMLQRPRTVFTAHLGRDPGAKNDMFLLTSAIVVTSSACFCITPEENYMAAVPPIPQNPFETLTIVGAGASICCCSDSSSQTGKAITKECLIILLINLLQTHLETSNYHPSEIMHP